MTIELYLVSGSPYAWRVQLALEHKGLAYTPRLLSLARGELRSPEHLARNPRGRVPVLVDDDVTLYESVAILAYLEARWPDPPLLGHSPAEVGAVWRVISEYTAYLDPAVEDFILPIYFGRADAQADLVRRAVVTIGDELGRLDAALARTSYLAGDALSAADLVVFPHVQSILRAAGKDAARAFDLPFLPLGTVHPALEAWRRRLEALPYYDRTYPPGWR